MTNFENINEMPSNSIELSGNQEGISDFAKDYLQELNINSEEWENLSENERKDVVANLRERIEEFGCVKLENQDKALRESDILPEILGEFRSEIFSEKISELKQCNSGNEISKDQFMEECPEGAQIVEMMDERLANDCEDGIMNNIKYYKLDNGDYALISNVEYASNTKAVFSDGSVYAKSGCLLEGNMGPNEVLNTPRAASNTTYFVDGRTVYEHDSLGRLVSETTVYDKDFEWKSDRSSLNQSYIRKGKDGIEGDESSHSVPYALGGPNEAINQTPMREDINRGSGSEWNKAEREITKAVYDDKTVFVEHLYSYEGNSARPTDISLSTKIGNEKIESIHFDNRVSENINTNYKMSLSELSENAYMDNRRSALSISELDYLKEAISDGTEFMIVQRIDELNGDIIPPKAIDSNREISELLGDKKDVIDKIFLEAPSDAVQVELISEKLSNIEGVKFNDWKNLSLEQKADVLQNIELEVSEIAHRPSCKVNVQQLPEGQLGYYNPQNKEIVINEFYLQSPTIEVHNECLDTILHEGRHAYQDFNMTCRQVHTSPGDVTNWYKNEHEYGYQDVETYGFKAYVMQPVECDARKFAEDILSKIKNQIC